MELKRKAERRGTKDRRFGGLDAVYQALTERQVVTDNRTGRTRRRIVDRRGHSSPFPNEDELYVIHVLGIEKLNSQRKKNGMPLLKIPTFEAWKKF